jgi:hypothetical protein
MKASKVIYKNGKMKRYDTGGRCEKNKAVIVIRRKNEG